MNPKRRIAWIEEVAGSEEAEWALLSPAERYVESAKLWPVYLAWGGSLDPEPDSQSPFDFPELERAVPGHGRPLSKVLAAWRRARRGE